MKKLLFLSVIIIAGISFSQSAEAQFFKQLKNEVKRRAENHVINDAGNVTDKAISKTENTAIKSVKTGNKLPTKEKYTPPKTPLPSTPTPQPKQALPVEKPKPVNAIASYKNYDFVPGDKVLFQTDFKKQSNAELPARLGMLKGTAEIQTYKGEKVLLINKGAAVCIVPLMDRANYLPGQFTVEFDFFYNAKDPQGYNKFLVNFYKRDQDNRHIAANPGDYYLEIYEASVINFGKAIIGKYLPQPLINSLKISNTWHHIAIYVHNNIAKVYIDQYRVAASNMMMKGITKMSIRTNGAMDYMIRNLRIAAGGSDAYHKIVTDGKLVTHGIHFATGSAKLLPESMGTINEIFKILKNHSELKFEIDGYTDNVGNADANLKLSKQRADAVKGKLVRMGISMSRLSTKGLGEEKPIDSNSTPEGKANNRRVEFVKK